MPATWHMRQTPRSTTATASSGPGSVIAAPHSRPRSTSSSPPRPGQKTRKALASGPRLQPFPGLAHDDVGVEVGQQADPAVLAGWRRGVAGQGSSRDAVHFDLLQLAVSASQDHSVRVWDLASGQCPHVFTGRVSEVTALAVPADGSWSAVFRRPRQHYTKMGPGDRRLRHVLTGSQMLAATSKARPASVA